MTPPFGKAIFISSGVKGQRQEAGGLICCVEPLYTVALRDKMLPLMFQS